MATKLTNEIIIKRIKEVHGDLYDLSLVKYKNSRTKIELVCKKHGKWLTRTEQLFRGQGCPRCGEIAVAKKHTYSFDKIIELAKNIHKNKYKYHEVVYTQVLDKLKIECPKHGIFYQAAQSHYYDKQGCPKCGNIKNAQIRAMPLEDFILKASKVHSDKYNYSKVNYKRSNIKVIIECPKHGDFLQKPNNHLNGVGCPNCNNSKGENIIKRILKENEIKFTQQKTFVGLKYNGKLKCDFYLPNYNTVIEFHGRQHYEPVRAWGGKEGLIEVQIRDRIKQKFLNESDINLLEINYKEKNIENLILVYLNKLKK